MEGFDGEGRNQAGLCFEAGVQLAHLLFGASNGAPMEKAAEFLAMATEAERATWLILDRSGQWHTLSSVGEGERVQRTWAPFHEGSWFATSPDGAAIAVFLHEKGRLLGVLELEGRDVLLNDERAGFLRYAGGLLGEWLGRRGVDEEFARNLEKLHRIERERRKLLRMLLKAHEAERRSLAADLHDDPLQVLSAAKIRLQTLSRKVGDEQCAATEHVAEMLNDCILKLRGLMFELRPVALDSGDLITPLRERLHQVELDTDLTTHLDGQVPDLVSPEVSVSLWRIAIEAINNVVKHAEAQNLWVSFSCLDNGCLMRVEDDGQGMARGGKKRNGHYGLINIQERAELIGGWLKVQQREAGGTLVTAWVPYFEEGALEVGDER